MSNTDFDDNDINFDALQTPANQAVIGAVNANPDVAARAMKLGKKLGAPPVAVEQAPEQFEQQDKIASGTSAMEGSREMQNYATGNPQAPKVSQDDWWNLRTFSDKLKALAPSWMSGENHKDYFEGLRELEKGEGSVATARERGQLEYERSATGSRIMGVDAAGQPINADLEKHYADIEESLKSFASPSTIGQQVGDMVGNMLGSWRATVAGGAAGAAFTPTFPMIGGSAGAMAGFASDQGRIAAGQKYMELREQGVDRNANLVASSLYGLVVGGINLLGAGTAAKPAQAAAKGVLDAALERAVADKGAMAALTKAVGGTIKQGIIGGTLMGVQNIASEIATSVAKTFTDDDEVKLHTLFNDPEERAKLVDTTAEAFINGAMLMAAIHIPVVGVNMIADGIHINQSKINGKALDEAMKARDATRTFERAPELIDEFVKLHDYENFGLDPVKALTIHKDNPQAFSFIPDFETKALEAEANGGMIDVDPRHYFGNVGTELHGDIKDDISINGQMSINEARRLEENPPKYTSVFHGSPYLFDRFDLSKVGTGEGAQAYGHGHYLTEDRGIAEGYRDNVTESKANNAQLTVNGEIHNPDFNKPKLTPREIALEDIRRFANEDFSPENFEKVRQEVLGMYERNHSGAHDPDVIANEQAIMKELRDLKGAQVAYKTPDLFPTLYRANITAPEESFLHWDQPLNGQTPEVQAGLEKLLTKLEADRPGLAEAIRKAIADAQGVVDPTNPFSAARFAPRTGDWLIKELERELGPAATRQLLSEAGVNGVKYRAAGHRAPDNTAPLHNFVIFNDDHIEITHRNDEPYPPEPPPEVAASPEAAQAYESASKELDLVAKAEARGAGLNGLFSDAKAAGMTKTEYTLYQRKLAKAQMEQDDKVYRAAEKEAKKRLTPTWAANKERIKLEVEPEIASSPEFFAMRAFEGKAPDGGEIPKIRLDTQEVKEMLGDYAGNRPDYPDQLPKGITEKDGLSPDDAAQLFGFDSGQDMLAKLGQAEQDRIARGESWGDRYKRVIDEEANRRMDLQYGKLDDAIQAEAREAALNAAQINVLSAELAHLAKLGGLETPFTREALQTQAREVFERRIVGKEAKADQWVKNAGKQARDAEMMLLKGKYAEAYKAKQRQMLAVMIAREAAGFAREQKRFEKNIKPFLKNESLNGVGQGYTDQIQKVLNLMLQYPTRRDMPELLRGNKTELGDFIKEKDLEGRQINAPEWFWDQSFTSQKDRRPQTLTVSQFRDLHEFMTQMIFHGKGEKIIQLGEEHAQYADAVNRAVTTLKGLKQKGDYDYDALREKILNRSRQYYDSALIRPEQVFQWADKWDRDGPFNQILVRALQDAKHVKSDLLNKLATEWKKLPEPERVKQIVSKGDFTDKYGRPMIIRRENMLAMALNTGSESNLQVLARGYGWESQKVEQFLITHMTPKDWEFVHGVWRLFDDHLFPLADKNAREMTGVGLKKVEPREVATGNGKLTGGYYPLIETYDSRLSTYREKEMNKGGPLPIPTRGYTKRRTGMAYPLELTLRGLATAINEQVHDIAFSRPWRDASRFMNDGAIKNAFSDAFGKDYLDRMLNYLKDVGNNGGRVNDLSNFAGFVREARHNMITALIGLKLGTATIHGGSAGLASLTESAREFNIPGLVDTTKNMVTQFQKNPQNAKRMTEWAREKSGEIRNRGHYWDRDVGQILESQFSGGKWTVARRNYAQFATGLVGALDQATAIPTFIAAYNHLIQAGKSDADAVFGAEQIVRNAHGANSIVDLPAIMRGGRDLNSEIAKFTTMFGGYFNHNYNRQRDIVRKADYDATGGTISKQTIVYAGMMGSLIGYLVGPSIIHSGVRGDRSGEDFWEHPGKWMISALLTQEASQHFGLRDVWYWYELGMKDKINAASPLSEFMTRVASPLKEAQHLVKKGTLSPEWFKTFSNALLPMTGIGPTTTMTDLADYLIKLDAGKARAPGSVWDYWRLLMDSKAPANRRHH